ncbi:MAG: DUF721 domain-containing protein [Planctomycetota bacterium]
MKGPRGRSSRGGPYQEPKPVEEILPAILRSVRPRASDPVVKLRQSWAEVVGEATARKSRVASCQDGEIVVEVASAALRQHLGVFLREEILESLRERHPELALNRLRCKVSGQF